jgi:hypothetical protein
VGSYVRLYLGLLFWREAPVLDESNVEGMVHGGGATAMYNQSLRKIDAAGRIENNTALRRNGFRGSAPTDT